MDFSRNQSIDLKNRSSDSYDRTSLACDILFLARGIGQASFSAKNRKAGNNAKCYANEKIGEFKVAVCSVYFEYAFIDRAYRKACDSAFP